jgi:thioesterase domain-containing protein
MTHDRSDSMPDAPVDTVLAETRAPKPASEASLRRIEAELLAMPPVAAMRLRLMDDDGVRLRLQAPLSANVNDKGCAFGGSLSSLMTLAGWALVGARLIDAGVDAEVYVAESQVHYRAPLYADLLAEASLAEGESWSRFFATLRSRGKARVDVVATVTLPDGGVATESRSRYVAKRRSATG